MKKSMLVLLALFVLSTTATFGKIARHNFQMNFAGGYQGIARPELTDLMFTENFRPVLVTIPGYVGHGGIASLELGYVLHSVRESGIVHGFNLMMDINASFFPNIEGGLGRSLQVSAGGYMLYSVGRQLESGRLMFDVIGYGVNYRAFSAEGSFPTFGGVSRQVNSVRGLSVVYVLPGVQYIMNNGFTIGWRNKVNINLGGDFSSSVSTVLSLGFTIGGGKQPWESNTTSTPAL